MNAVPIDRTPYRQDCTICAYFLHHDRGEAASQATINSQAESIWTGIEQGLQAIISDPWIVNRSTYLRVHQAVTVSFLHATTDAAGVLRHHFGSEMFEYLYYRLDDFLKQYVLDLAGELVVTDGNITDSLIYARERGKCRKMVQINTHLFAAVQKQWVEFIRQTDVQMLSVEALHWRRWEEVFGSEEAVRNPRPVGITAD